MSCSDCPDFIIAPVSAQCAQTLQIISHITYLTKAFASLFANAGGGVTANLQGIVAAIPAPIVLDVSTLFGLLTCPLTPLAIGLELSQMEDMTPKQLWVVLRPVLQAQIREVQTNYTAALSALPEADYTLNLRKYVQEMYRAMQDPGVFLTGYTTDLQMAETVKAACPAIYANPKWAFQALADAAVDFSFDGLLPNGIDPRAQGIMRTLAQGEILILSWKQLALTTP